MCWVRQAWTDNKKGKLGIFLSLKIIFLHNFGIFRAINISTLQLSLLAGFGAVLSLSGGDKAKQSGPGFASVTFVFVVGDPCMFVGLF